MSGTIWAVVVAGGGGGASPSGNGGLGGSNASVTGNQSASGAPGENGMAGGGGGYQGGSAGELLVHNHSDNCMRTEDLGYVYVDQDYNTQTVTNNIGGWWLTGRRKVVGTDDELILPPDGLEKDYLIPTNGNKTMNVKVHAKAWDSKAMDTFIEVAIYNSDKQLIYSYYADANSQEVDGIPGESWEDDDGWHGTPDVFEVDKTLTVDVADTDGVWIVYSISTKHIEDGVKGAACHYALHIYSVSFAGNIITYPICGYQEGQVLSSKPAYGGSNYVNAAQAYHYTDEAGSRAGNGAAEIRSDVIGFQESLFLNDVSAPDLAAPERIDASSVIRDALDKNQVKISWQEPKDNGTDYYHKAESYLVGSTSLLCTSNITKNTLVSGVRGYYTLLDSNPSTNVSAANGSFSAESTRIVTAISTVQYLHVAPVDVAGNVGGTTHIRIDAGEVLWKLYTRQLSIDEADNVYEAGQEKTWYVRADGSTPFTLHHSAYMDGEATKSYQINYTIFQTQADGGTAKNITFTPNHEISSENIVTEAQGLTYTVEGATLLGQYPYIVTERSNQNRDMEATQKFTMDRAAHGRSIDVFPVAGAAYSEGIQYSDENTDRQNGIVLIGDGEAPVISGAEILEQLKLIDREKEDVTVRLSAEDDLSGVREFYLEIYNLDNWSTQTYHADGNGEIVVEITKDEAVFTGDFSVTIHAIDNVGNVRTQSYDTTEFALQTKLERILEPHDPIFQRGESGILSIKAFGYVEKIVVEFPDALEEERTYSTEFVYDVPEYIAEEQIQFMVPLYAEERDDYVIKITAYKNGEKLVSNEPMMVVSGTVLDDFRTRIR